MRREVIAAIVAILVSFPLKLSEVVFLSSMARPDLLMGLAIASGWAAGWGYGVPGAFLIGLLEDLIVGRILGVRAISLALAAAISASARDYVTPEVIIPRAIVSGGAAILSDSAAFGLYSMNGYSVTWYHFFSGILRYGVIWSMVLTLPFTHLLVYLSAKIERALPRRKPKRGFSA